MPLDNVGTRSNNAFDELALFFEDLGERFWDLASSVDGKPILGPYLTAPFYDIARLNFKLASGSRAWANLYYQVITLLDRGVSIETLNEFIKRLFPGWDRFRTQTNAFIRDILVSLIRYGSQFIYYPGNWVRDRLREVWPELYNLVADFDRYLFSWFQRNFYLLYLLYRDPRAFFQTLIKYLIADAYAFLQDPVGFMKTRIAQWLGVPYSFWNNPFLEIFNRILQTFETMFLSVSSRLYRLSERVLRFFWEGVS